MVSLGSRMNSSTGMVVPVMRLCTTALSPGGTFSLAGGGYVRE
jgi:hypothetical protein